MECGLEREQSFERSVGARAFVHFEHDLLTLGLRAIGTAEAYRYGNNFVVELASLNRGQRFLMATQREFVRRFARDAIPLRDSLGSQSHGKIRIRIVIDEPGIG